MRPHRAYRAVLAAAAIVVFGSCSDMSGPGPTMAVVVTPPEATVRAGETVQLTATLEDENGNPQPTPDVTWTSSNLGVAMVSSSGLVTGGAVGGPVTITATVGSSSDRATITVINGLPAQLTVDTQPAAVATSGSALGRQPVIQLQDSQGNDATESGVTVTAVIDEGSGTLSNATATTDEDGLATFSGLAITGPTGTYRLRFEATGLAAVTSQAINLTAVGALSVATEPSSSVQSGSVFATQPEIMVQDLGGGPVPGETVTASIVSGAGTLIGTTTATSAEDGVAAFTDLGITDAIGDHRLEFTAGSVSIESATISVVAGPPTQLQILTQPSTSAQSGVPFVQQPRIEVEDDLGNPVEGVGVTATIESGGGTLNGTKTAVTDGSGIATFTDLSISGTSGDRTLRFTAGSSSIISGTIEVDVGPAASISIVVQPSDVAENSVEFDQQPVVEVLDDGGNPVSGISVGATIAAGGGVLNGTTTATTNAAGQATFTDLSITGTVGVHALEFFAGTASVTSQAIDLTAGPAVQITIVTQPGSTAQNGEPLDPQPTVDVRDSGGNAAAGSVVTAEIFSGGGTLGGNETAAVGSDGLATFSDLSITGTLGERVLRFTSGVAGANSDPIDLEAGPLAQLAIITQPSSSAPNAEPFPQQPTIQAQDVGGNPISGVDITAVIASGGGTLGGTTMMTTDGSGLAAFIDLSITGTVGNRTLRFSNNGLEVTSNTIEIVAGEPTAVAILTQPPEFTVSGVTFSPSPVVEVRDVSDNPVPGEDVDVAIDTGDGTLGGTTTATTTGSGAATFMNLSLIGDLGANTLVFSSNGAQMTSTQVNVSYGQGLHEDVEYCGGQLLDVYAPDNSIPRPVPVAVYVHGGGWTNRNKQTGVFLDPVTDTLVNRGYLVVSINYRLAPTNPWPAQIHDVKCVVRHLRAEAGDYGFDGVRIGAWGDSAGGHLVAMLGLADDNDGTVHDLEGNQGYAGQSSRVAAAATIAAITDMTSSQAPDHDELGFTPSSVFDTWPGPSTELDEASPIWWTTSDDPPFLMFHGDEDTTVNHAQGVRLRDSINSSGGSATLITVQNGGHELQDVGMGTPSMTIEEVADAIADFLDTHVRFNP